MSDSINVPYSVVSIVGIDFIFHWLRKNIPAMQREGWSYSMDNDDYIFCFNKRGDACNFLLEIEAMWCEKLSNRFVRLLNGMNIIISLHADTKVSDVVFWIIENTTGKWSCKRQAVFEPAGVMFSFKNEADYMYFSLKWK